MRKALVLLLLLPLTMAQDLGPVLDPLNEVAGQVVPPTVDAVYTALGQNITQEDVRLFLDMNVSKGEVGLMGLLIGSGNAEVQATIDARVELRVISSDRIRAVIEGDNAYNISMENATWLTDLYIPAEVFRATAAAEVVAAFQKDQEAALATMLAELVPELEVISIEMAWKNTNPLGVFDDLSLTEKPIVVEVHAVVQYLRVESISSLLSVYLDRSDSEKEKAESKKDYVSNLKGDNGDPLRSRDFYSAAAYTQLLNISMQPGWSLDVTLRVPRGFSFEYANAEVERNGPREIGFMVESGDLEAHEILLASITHRRAVALSMFAAMMLVGSIGGAPLRWVYSRFRLQKIGNPESKNEEPLHQS